MTKTQAAFLTAVLLIVIALGGWGAYAYTQQAKPAAVIPPTIATSTIPAVPAPVVAPAPSYGTTTVALGQKMQRGDITLMPLSIAEDSRCPLGVLCIQAGTVRVSVRITTPSGTLTQILTLEKPFTIGKETITLIGVQPIKRQHGGITPDEYRLTFDIEG